MAQDKLYFDFNTGGVTMPIFNVTYETDSELFFIYGTLQTKHRNHHLMLDDCKLIRLTTSLNDFALIELYRGTPAIVSCKGNTVHGELWSIGKKTQKILSILEQELDKTCIKIYDTGEYKPAYTYVYNKSYKPKSFLGIGRWELGTSASSFEGLLNLYIKEDIQ